MAVVVEYYCSINNYCWQASTSYIASCANRMASFVKIERSVGQNGVPPHPGGFVVGAHFEVWDLLI